MSRGHDRERDVKRLLESWGWVVVRSAGSKVLDLMAVGCGELRHPTNNERTFALPQVLTIEVKSTEKTPYERFGPKDREALKRMAAKCGAKPLLAYWPPFGGLEWIEASTWPLSERN